MPRHQQHARLSTGVAGLDTILRGGILSGSGYLISGEPGAGKSILSNQICFAHIANGGRALYVTVLTEAHTRMLAYIRSMSFYAEEPIGDTLLYISGYSILEQGGLPALLEMLRSEVRSHRASLLVIDGLSTLEASAGTYLEFKRFFSDLLTSLEMLGCTTLVQAHQERDNSATMIHSIVDGVIRLIDHRVGLYAIRELEVQKSRGSAALRGRHQFEITSDGLVVHPRTEAVYANTAQPAPGPRKRMRFGSSGLDEMLHGGVLEGSSTLLLGPPGIGKTVLGLHMLAEGARAGEQGLYFGFYEATSQLLEKGDSTGIELSSAVQNGQIDIIWQPPVESGLDELAERLLSAVQERGVKRLVVDGLRAFERSSVYPERLGAFFAGLNARLHQLGVTSVFTYTLPEILSSTVQVLTPGAEEADNLILLRYVELRSQLYRLISLVKIRDSAYEPSIREYRITSGGIDVAPTFESAEQILTGRAQPTGTQGTHERERQGDKQTG